MYVTFIIHSLVGRPVGYLLVLATVYRTDVPGNSIAMSYGRSASSGHPGLHSHQQCELTLSDLANILTRVR